MNNPENLEQAMEAMKASVARDSQNTLSQEEITRPFYEKVSAGIESERNRVIEHFHYSSDKLGSISFFEPQSYVENNGLVIFSNGAEEAREGIISFKKRLLTSYITDLDSPILHRIYSLLQEGSKRIQVEELIHYDLRGDFVKLLEEEF